jgi:hypothetical protein
MAIEDAMKFVVTLNNYEDTIQSKAFKNVADKYLSYASVVIKSLAISLKEALEQSAQEPAAWTDEFKMYLEWDKEALCDKAVCHEYEAIPLYPHPAPQPTQKHETWIDVNDKLPEPEINFLSFSKTYGYQVSMYSNNPFNSTLLPTFEKLKIDKWMPIPVYTLPHQWQGLTDCEIQNITWKIWGADALDPELDYARAIEQALKEKNHG